MVQQVNPAGRCAAVGYEQGCIYGEARDPHVSGSPQIMLTKMFMIKLLKTIWSQCICIYISNYIKIVDGLKLFQKIKGKF